LRLLGAAAAVVQVTDRNNGKFTHDYQPAMPLLVIDFTSLEGRDGKLAVKELAAVTPTVIGSHHMSLRYLRVRNRNSV